jgi:DNA-binding transcriptional LysR family regulator
MTAQPDWDDLHLFLVVARTGSFTAAAELLGVHHTTVARRLEQLETLLRTRLVDRLARGTRLTPAGEALFAPTARIEEDVLAATRAVAGHDQHLTGTVRLTTAADLVVLVLPMLARFRERYPDVQLELDVADAFRDLGRREADVALRASHNAPDQAVARRVAACAWAPYRKVGAPTQRWVRLGGALQHLNPVAEQDRRSPHPPAITVSAVATAVEAVRAGLGEGLLPCFVGDRDPTLVRTGGPLPDAGGSLWLLVHTDLRRVHRVRALVEHLHEGLVELRPLLEGEVPREGAAEAIGDS